MSDTRSQIGDAPQGESLIATVLAEAGLDAWTDDGWVFVRLADGRVLWIGAEHGASLDASLS